GAALSDVFSNIYMLTFDYEMHNYISNLGGFYRRYADDILIVSCQSKWPRVERFLHANLSDLGPSIKLNEQKTERSNIRRSLTGVSVTPALNYLGLFFDGRVTKIRDCTLSRYYSKMASRINAAKRRASKTGLLKKRPI